MKYAAGGEDEIKAENGHKTAWHSSALQARELLQWQRLDCAPYSVASKPNPCVPKAATCEPADECGCRELLETVIELLHALLEPGPGHAVPQGGARLMRIKEGYVSTADERYGLTYRENQVLAEMIDGKSNRQIAADLAISMCTVKTHVSNILSKMGAKSRTEAVALTLAKQDGTDVVD